MTPLCSLDCGRPKAHKQLKTGDRQWHVTTSGCKAEAMAAGFGATTVNRVAYKTNFMFFLSASNFMYLSFSN
jgi:hypothetical protein